jgi:hypothetical protein
VALALTTVPLDPVMDTALHGKARRNWCVYSLTRRVLGTGVQVPVHPSSSSIQTFFNPFDKASRSGMVLET